MPDDTYTIEKGDGKGTVVKLKKVQPIVIQRSLRGIEMPDRPFYEVKTASGKTQVFPLDEEAAAEDPRTKAQWDYYVEQLNNAQSEQSERVLFVLLTMGTECSVPDDGWEEIQELMGIEVPRHKDGRRASWLMYVLDQEELMTLTGKIMRLTGIDDELVAQAEQSFRSEVSAESGRPVQIPDIRPDQRESPERSLASQQPAGTSGYSI